MCCCEGNVVKAYKQWPKVWEIIPNNLGGLDSISWKALKQSKDCLGLFLWMAASVHIYNKVQPALPGNLPYGFPTCLASPHISQLTSESLNILSDRFCFSSSALNRYSNWVIIMVTLRDTIISPIYRWVNRGTGRLRNCLRVLPPERGAGL